MAIFAPPAPHFVATLVGLRRGFEALGCEVHIGWPLPDRRTLRAFIGAFRPDLVFEINRTGNDALDGERLPCPHVAWIEAARYDTRWLGDRLSDGLGGNDLAYFMLPPSLLGLGDCAPADWRLLAPGADPAVFHPAPAPTRWDMSLCGHLYPPPSPRLATATVTVGGEHMGTFGDLWTAATGWPLARLAASHAATLENVAAYYRRRGGRIAADAFDPDILFLIDEYIPRTAARSVVADRMLDVSDKVRFHGNAGWLLWPRLARHYGGELHDPHAVADLYRASAINVHMASWPLHFRTVDCMATAGVVFINRTDHPEQAALFDREFAEGEHYVAYDEQDLPDLARRYLADAPARARIGAAAAARIADGHTWRHRAAQVLGDLGLRP